MRRTGFIIAVGLLAATLVSPAFAAGDDPASSPPIFCGNGIPGGVNCIASKKELKEARYAFDRGVKLKDHRRLEEAFTHFDIDTRLAPQNIQFLTARERVKAQLVFNHIQRGNVLLLENSRAQAAAEFRSALDLDGENEFARERLEEASRELAPALPRALPAPVAGSGEIYLQPKDKRAPFDLRGGVHRLFAERSTAYGVTTEFDDSVQSRQVRFNIDDVDFFTAVKLACQVSKTMWAALDTHRLVLAADNPENHKQFDRMSLRTFVLPPHSTPQESTDLVTTMRNMFDLRFVSSGQTADTGEGRGPQPVLDGHAGGLRGRSLHQFPAALSVNESWVRSLENMNIRASQGNDATFHLGERYPVLNASYAPIFNSPQISAVLGNQTYVPPFPSVSYEDLGLNVKVKPVIHGDGSVSLELELQVRSLTGQSNNGVPIISNREYKGSINLKDGEPAVVAGEVSRTDTLSMSGIPGLGFLPGLNQAMVNNTKQSDTDELMIVITPHVLANFNRTTPEIWVSEK